MKFVIVILLLFSVSGLYVFDKYSIPLLIDEDYNCEEHPGFISDSNPYPFESSQHYVNRHAASVKKQIEEVCD